MKNSLRYAFTNVGSPSGVIRPRRCLIECCLGDGIIHSGAHHAPRPSKFELVINLKTAKFLQQRADEVIE